MDDFDLFEDSSSLKICDGCGNKFEKDELKRCRICGKYYCPECRKTHDCRINPMDSELEKIDISHKEISVTPQLKDDELKCDVCGGIFQKSELRKCKKCDAVLCPDCREWHKCNSHKQEKYEPKIEEKPKSKISTSNLVFIIIAVIICVSIISCSVCAFSGANFSSGTQNPNVPSSVETYPSNTPAQNQDVPYTSQTSTSKPTQTKYSIGQILTISDVLVKAQVGVTNVIRGNQANAIVADGNMFNAEPASGHEYLIYEVYVKNNDDENLPLIYTDFSVYANGVEPSLSYAVLPKEYQSFNSLGEIMPNAVTTGWDVAEVPIGSNVLISYNTFLKDTKYYFTVPSSNSVNNPPYVETYSSNTPAPTSTVKIKSPSEVFDSYFKEFKYYDDEDLFDLLSSNTQSRVSKTGLYNQFYSYLLSGLGLSDYSITRNDVGTNTATIDAIITCKTGGFKYTTEKTIDFVKENGEWKVNDFVDLLT